MRMRETDGYDVINFTPVKFIDNMGSDERIVDAARVSFKKLAKNYTSQQNEKLINYLWKHNHWTPFGHPQLTFHFKAPIFIARQFVKHQVGFVWNEVSRRYVSDDPFFFVPDTWRKRPDNMKQGSVKDGEVVVDDGILANYKHKMREHVSDYKHMISQGIAPEQVRMAMPQSMMTEWYWTGSLAAWLRFVKLRGDEHAQAECWPYANAVREHLYNLYPMAMKAFTNAQDLR